MTYHFRGGRTTPGGEPLWYDTVSGATKIPPKEWSPFLDVREQVLPLAGPWSTWRPIFSGLESGRVEVQLAWYPHEAAVMQTLQTAVGGKRAHVPHAARPVSSPKQRNDGRVGRLESENAWRASFPKRRSSKSTSPGRKTRPARSA